MEENTEAQFVSILKNVWPKTRANKMEYNFVFFHQNSGKNHYKNLTYKLFENVTKFRHLGKMVTIKMAFMKKLRADYILYTWMLATFLLKTFLPVNLQYADFNVTIHRNIISPVHHGCKTLSLTLMVRYTLRNFIMFWNNSREHLNQREERGRKTQIPVLVPLFRENVLWLCVNAPVRDRYVPLWWPRMWKILFRQSGKYLIGSWPERE
jgi:hypothetical protein